ncbi:MAG: hypothetical protein AB9907_17550 [Flexilinea sp.]
MNTFADYKAFILAMLGDEKQKRYSDDMLKAGLRMALADYDRFLPMRTEVTVTVNRSNGNQVFLDWYPAFDQTVLGVRRSGTGSARGFFGNTANRFLHERISTGSLITLFNQRPFAKGEKIILQLSGQHTIENLYEAHDTSVPDGHADTLCRGAAGYAMQIRASAVGEVFGKRIEDYNNLIQQGKLMIGRFLQTLEEISRLQGGFGAAIPTGKGFDVDG